MKASFRRPVADDILALHELIEGAYRGDSAKRGWTHEADLLGGQRTDRAALAEMIADPAQVLILAEADRPVGCVSLRQLDATAMYLGLLTVDPARQAAGLGRALLAEAERTAREAGAIRMEMTVIRQRADLIAWYDRRGYGATGEVRPFPLDDARFGLPRTRDLEFVVLEKPL